MGNVFGFWWFLLLKTSFLVSAEDPHRAYFLIHYSSWQACNVPFCSNAPLLICGVLDDGLLSIYHVLLELMRQHTFVKESRKDRMEMNHRDQSASSEQNPSASKSKRDAHLRSVSIWTNGLFCSKLLLLGCSKKQEKHNTHKLES